jgi:hypothetical protein
LTPHGFKEATTDEETIRNWWSKRSAANIGVAMGHISGAVVIDVDGLEGEENLKALPPLPETFTVHTARGRHLYFAYTEPLRSRRLAPGLDFKADGGYVLAAPSIHPSGARYEVIDHRTPRQLPDDFLKLLTRSALPVQQGDSVDGGKITEGQRNRFLTSVAGTMRRRGMSREAILAALREENKARCDPALSEGEVEKIARSVSRYEPVAAKSGPRRAMASKGAPQTNGGEGTGGEESGPYLIHDRCLCYLKHTQNGPVPIRLANFCAGITEEIILDDGRDQSRAFEVTGNLASGQPLPGIRIPAEKVSAMNWVPESWGARAVVSAGQGAKDRAREAIQLLSGGVPQRRVFTHTGWAEVDGIPVFLHSGGAVGINAIEVDLPPDLRRYRLPPVAENPRAAMELSLRLLEVAPLRIAAPLWAGVFRSPLASFLPLDVSIFLHGPTGALKSSLAALYLSHHGSFSRTTLPGAWSSTANALERRAFILKDVTFVVDDYAPSALDAREMEAKASRLLRSQGNLAGRGRLRADASERGAYQPRGLILATGEQFPAGQSVLARTLLVEMEPGDVNIEILSQLQAAADRLSHAMAAYIAWLIPQAREVANTLAEIFQGARLRTFKAGTHLRIPETIAQLWVGLNAGLQFAQEIGAVSAARGEELQDKCWSAFLELGKDQSAIIEGERPSRRFLEILATILTQGEGRCVPRGTNPPSDMRGVFLGWYDAERIYFLPEAAFRAVAEFSRRAGEAFPVRRTTLLRNLKREGISECDPERTLKNIQTIHNQNPSRVLCVRREAAERLIGEPLFVSFASFSDRKGD